MAPFEYFLEKYGSALQILLLLAAAGIFLSIDINRPLVDYDEATYAKVVVDTLHSGNFLTMQLSGGDWFEKPPLYIWAAMGSVKLFGEHEFAFRLPGLLASMLCCWLVYLIIKEHTHDSWAAAFGFLVLLTSNSFFFYAREARLDSAVIAAILAALLFFLKARENEKLLFWILPCIAIGFMFKSVIALLAIPIIIFYSLMYCRWSYLASRYFWNGFILSLLIVVPWHLVETLRGGWAFWGDYLGRQVFQRGVSTLTGTDSYADYLILIPWYVPWNFAIASGLVLILCTGLSKRVKELISARDILVPLAVAAFVFFAFTLARTHLSPYVMPAFPFFAISIGIIFHYLYSLARKNEETLILFLLAALFLVGAGALFCYTYRYAMVPGYGPEEAAIGRLYLEDSSRAPGPVYMLDWLVAEDINYYGDTHASIFNTRDVSGTRFEGPFYLVSELPAASYFFTESGQSKYPGLQVLYVGKRLVLMYSDRDMQLPIFNYSY